MRKYEWIYREHSVSERRRTVALHGVERQCNYGKDFNSKQKFV